MPRRPKSPCRHRGCPALLDKPGFCEQHQAAAWQRREGAPERMRGRKLQRERERLFSEQPLCEECLRHGRVTEATQRDHIVPLAEGGTDERSNVQALCQSCHDAKTAGEALRARRRLSGRRS